MSEPTGTSVPLVSLSASSVFTTNVCPAAAFLEFNPLGKVPRNTMKGTATVVFWGFAGFGAGCVCAGAVNENERRQTVITIDLHLIICSPTPKQRIETTLYNKTSIAE